MSQFNIYKNENLLLGKKGLPSNLFMNEAQENNSEQRFKRSAWKDDLVCEMSIQSV